MSAGVCLIAILVREWGGIQMIGHRAVVNWVIFFVDPLENELSGKSSKVNVSNTSLSAW